MNHKPGALITVVMVVTILVSGSPSVAADIIVPEADESPAYVSLELVGQTELTVAPHFSLAAWAGGGGVFGFTGGGFGLEAGLEPRVYARGDVAQGPALGVYGGFAYMFTPDLRSYNGFTPGIKLTWVKPIRGAFVAEPYLSVSNPWVFNNGERSPYQLPGLFTIGCRLGVRYLFAATR